MSIRKVPTGFIAGLMIALAMSLSACEPTLDANNEADLQESFREIYNSLDEKKQAKFEQAYRSIVWDVLMSGAATPMAKENELRKRIDGKTADEIIAEASKN